MEGLLYGVGDKVYYRPNGPMDTGRIVEVADPRTTLDPYRVKWDDDGSEDGWYPVKHLALS